MCFAVGMCAALCDGEVLGEPFGWRVDDGRGNEDDDVVEQCLRHNVFSGAYRLGSAKVKSESRSKKRTGVVEL